MSFTLLLWKGASVLLHDQIFNVCVQLLVVHLHVDQPLWRRQYDKSNRSFDTFVHVIVQHTIYVYGRWLSDFRFFSFAKLQPLTTDVSANETDNQNRHLACKEVLELNRVNIQYFFTVIVSHLHHA